MKFKSALPFIAVAVMVFLGVVSAFVCNGISNAKNGADLSYNDRTLFERKNIFVSVKNPVSDTLDVSMVVSFDPKNKTIKTISIPSDTRVKIASSDQMFKDILNIGGVEMLRSSIERIVPLPVDYHLIINSQDLYCPDGNYRGLLEDVFSYYLWEQDDLESYLREILRLSNTDLSMFKTENYAAFIKLFSSHINGKYTVPGLKQEIGGRLFYVVDELKTNEMINTSILD